MRQITASSPNPAVRLTINDEWWRETTTNLFFAKPVQAPCCGRMSAWFVNRDGRTLYWSCDDEKQMART